MILQASSRKRDTALLAGDKGYVRYMQQYALKGEGAAGGKCRATTRYSTYIDNDIEEYTRCRVVLYVSTTEH